MDKPPIEELRAILDRAAALDALGGGTPMRTSRQEIVAMLVDVLHDSIGKAIRVDVNLLPVNWRINRTWDDTVEQANRVLIKGVVKVAEPTVGLQIPGGPSFTVGMSTFCEAVRGFRIVDAP